ncbi:sensor histidine kinase [Halomonas saccharevitans]|uniref:histidine kinase n=1 Tax=Halomonas saccharevitans TaxID=416872 RepID=A0ABU3N9P2_9GAMM|nr:sensor histidine kinase [Halomonas saccharevitans]MDT8877923.1 sensor histidine kinase [Halomonas saccharevitans]
MTSGLVVVILAFGYLALLFLIAAWGDRRAALGRSLIGSPTVYALSIAVYCTAWTFYGSVGRAAQFGPSFLLIYLGPTLAMLMAPFVIGKMVRIASAQRITSIADFISARYGKSSSLGALVALIALVGITPYIALQLKAITVSHAVLVNYPQAADLPLADERFWSDRSFWVALVLAVFIILFGTRHLDASERHEGMVAAIAFESLVKLVAFLAVGVFTVFVLFNGPADLFAQVGERAELTRLLSLEAVPGGALGWVGMLALAFLAFFTLPRQFQVLVVENVDERHIKRAGWLFPLYLLVINLFVIPIALAGLLLGGGDSDSFVLTLPLSAGLEALPLLVFIGGLSAATGMMIVETIALSTMVSNQLVMPLLLRSNRLHLSTRGELAGWLLGIRRVSILLILLLGYLYHALIGETYSLVTIGLVSFAAASQFAPALLIGLYWRGARRRGAALGMSAGFLVWAWTLLIPGFAQSGWLDPGFLAQGPWGIDWLRPYALFGLEGWDIYTHSLLWSLVANVGLLVGVSLFTRPSALEQTQAALFTEAMPPGLVPTSLWQGQTTRGELRALLDRYLGEATSRRVFAHPAGEADETEDDDQPASAALSLRAEQALAGSLGSASARVLIDSVARGEAPDLESILRILDTTSETLEMNRRLEQKSSELARASEELRAANERLRELDRLKDEFVAMVSHELRTPLTSIRAFAEILRDNQALPDEKREHFLDVVVRESQRLSRLIEEILDLARLESGRLTLDPKRLDLVALTRQSVDAVQRLQEDRGVTLEVEITPETAWVIGDADRLEQVTINLLDNAGKFAADDDPRVLLRLARHKNHYRLAVEDNGPGIAEGERERVFEKFHQIQHQESGETRGRPRGSGLGLPISRGIVAHLGGRLWIEEASRLGGACLVMELPEAPAEDPSLGKEAGKEAGGVPDETPESKPGGRPDGA